MIGQHALDRNLKQFSEFPEKNRHYSNQMLFRFQSLDLILITGMTFFKEVCKFERPQFSFETKIVLEILFSPMIASHSNPPSGKQREKLPN